MPTNIFQKMLRATMHCFDITRFPPEPLRIPLTMRFEEPVHHRPMSTREY
jgi:hypothetical protein